MGIASLGKAPTDNQIELDTALFSRKVFEYSAAGLTVFDLNGRILKVNKAFCDLIGYAEEELLGKSIEDMAALTHPDDRERNLNFLRSFLSSDLSSGQIEKRYIHKEGHFVWAVLSVAAVLDADGQPAFFITQTQNITRRKEAEQALRDSEERFRLAARAANDVLWDWDIRTGEAWYSEGIVDRLGTQTFDGRIDTRDWLQYIHPDDRERAGKRLREALSERSESWVDDFRIISANGTDVHVANRAYILYDTNGEPVRMVGALVDITERELYERQLLEKTEAQAQLLHQLLTAQEAERKRLSMDIHDGPLQSLGVTALALDRAMRKMDQGQSEAARSELAFIRENLSDTVDEIRAVLKDMSLDVLRTYGFNVALQNYIDWFSSTTNIKVELRNSLNTRLRPDAELLLYRLAQEALANVRKHSEANQVRVIMSTPASKQGEELELVIGDNGKGFDVAAAQKRHEGGHGLGLRSMGERIEAAGGTMQIYSQRGEGTTLTFRLPIMKGQKGIVSTGDLAESKR